MTAIAGLRYSIYSIAAVGMSLGTLYRSISTKNNATINILTTTLGTMGAAATTTIGFAGSVIAEACMVKATTSSLFKTFTLGSSAVAITLAISSELTLAKSSKGTLKDKIIVTSMTILGIGIIATEATEINGIPLAGFLVLIASLNAAVFANKKIRYEGFSTISQGLLEGAEAAFMIGLEASFITKLKTGIEIKIEKYSNLKNFGFAKLGKVQ